MTKLLRITTVPISLNKLIAGQPAFMQSKGIEVFLASAEGDDVQKVINRENVPHYVLPLTRVISPIADLWALIKTISLIIKLKPTIVHTHTPKAGLIGMLAAYLCRIPVRMHTVAGLPLLEAVGAKRKLLNLIEKITSFCATKVYPNSFELKKIMLDNKLSSETKTSVIGKGSSNGIDTSWFSQEAIGDQSNLKEQLGIKDDEIVCCFVGRVVKDKGITELIDAFQKIIEEKYKVKLLLVGPKEPKLDPLYSRTEKLIHENGSIIEVGYQEDVRLYLAISDMFVFPSYREGFPNVVMQAGAMNLPCVVTNINGSNELINHGENGEIVEVRDVDGLYQSVKKIITDDVYRNKLASNARKNIMDSFEQRYVWEEIYKEYKKLSNGRN